MKYVRDMKKYGWEIVEEAGLDARTLWPSDIAFIPYLKSYEHCISGSELTRRAKTKLDANVSQCGAELFLKNPEWPLPESPKPEMSVFFTGTVWRRKSDGRRAIPYLFFDAFGEWHLYFQWLDLVFPSGGLIARCVW